MSTAAASPPDSLTAEQFWSTYCRYKLKGQPYHHMTHEDIPPAYAEVDVKLIDNGKEFDGFMMAGVVGSRISSSADILLSPTGQNDTVKPAAGWWMCIKKQNVTSAQEEAEAEMKEIMRQIEQLQSAHEASRTANQ